jgi:hypothetical protein
MARSANTLRRAGALLLALLAFGAGRLSAQGSGTGNHVRVGVTFGGISTVGMSVEYVDEHRSLDLTVGTWSFRDVSAAVVVREYFGAGDLLPFVGVGLWLVGAHPSGERTGFAAVLHAPIGLDWQALDNNYLGLAMNVNRALWVRRTDPEDDLPINRRLVPLPGVYYRWGR